MTAYPDSNFVSIKYLRCNLALNLAAFGVAKRIRAAEQCDPSRELVTYLD